MNPFALFMNPFGMGCCCNFSMSMPYVDILPFLNTPIFRDTRYDYLLDPNLALRQCQQQMAQGGFWGGSATLPGFTFPAIAGLSNPAFPTIGGGGWQPRTETEEEKKKREERQAEEKQPEYIEKKAKVDEYKSYFNKLKELLDADTKNSTEFKELESKFNEALKENKIDDSIKKLEDVFKNIDKETLTKIALADKSIDSELFDIGYNFPAAISQHVNNAAQKPVDDLISSLNLNDPTNVGAFGNSALKIKDSILHIISRWNDTCKPDEKGIIRGLAKHLPEDKPDDPVKNQIHYRDCIQDVTKCLILKASDLVDKNGGAKALPLLSKQIEATRNKLDVIEAVDYDNNERVKKSQVYALADEFDKLYVMLRLVEADVMNQRIVNKYGKKMNALIEGAIPDDIVIKETKADLEAEGFKNIPSSDKLDKIDIKEKGIKIKKNEDNVNVDEKYKDNPQGLLDAVLTKVSDDSNVYKTNSFDGNDGGVKYYTIQDGKIVECNSEGIAAENAPEVKGSDIEKYAKTISDIESLINRDVIVLYTDKPFPVFKEKTEDGVTSYDCYALIGNTFGKIKNCHGFREHNGKIRATGGAQKALCELKESDLEEIDDVSKIKSQKEKEEEKEQVSEAKRAKAYADATLITEETINTLAEAKSPKKRMELSKIIITTKIRQKAEAEGKSEEEIQQMIDNAEEEMVVEDLSEKASKGNFRLNNGYFRSKYKGEIRYYRYDEKNQNLMLLDGLKDLSETGIATIKTSKGDEKVEARENLLDEYENDEAKIDKAVQEYGLSFAKCVSGGNSDEDYKSAKRKLNCLIATLDSKSFDNKQKVRFIINFIKGYQSNCHLYTAQEKGICGQIMHESRGFEMGKNIDELESKLHYVIKIAEYVKLVVNYMLTEAEDTNDIDDNDKAAIDDILNEVKNDGKPIDTRGIDKIIDKIIKVYDKKYNESEKDDNDNNGNE